VGPIAALATSVALSSLVVVGDGVPQPLTDTPGDVQRGRAIVASRQQGLCLLCHQAPISEVRDQGNLAGNLQAAASRLTAAQLRLRVADAKRLDPQGLMPSMHRVADDPDAQRVGAAWRGKPVLDAQQVEDVVAYLLSLK
jgi:L-cysteine S-thiosulfotransferase